MAQVVLIHGIGQQASTVTEQQAQWLPSLVKGVLASRHPHAADVAARLAAATGPHRRPLAEMAFYGDLYRPTDTQGEDAPASPQAEDLAETLAAALLTRAAASGDPRLAGEAANALAQVDAQRRVGPDRDGVQGLGARTRGAVAVLDANPWLSARIFGLLQKARPDLLQVTRYLTEDTLRAAVQAVVTALLDDDTRLVIGHSLGSVVAWEACRRLDRPLPMLITLGSPLGLDGVIYPRLRPQPPTWPPPVHRWLNIAHPHDIIAVEPDLRPLFPAPHGPATIEIHTRASKHDHHAAAGYLGEPATGHAVTDALRAE